MRHLACVLLLAASSIVSACRANRASAEQCRAIFDRLVVLELKEMGFADPALARLKQVELAARYRDELAACVGRRLPARAMACVASARTAEALSHDCLR